MKMMMMNDEGGNDSDLMLKLILRDLHIHVNRAKET